MGVGQFHLGYPDGGPADDRILRLFHKGTNLARKVLAVRSIVAGKVGGQDGSPRYMSDRRLVAANS